MTFHILSDGNIVEAYEHNDNYNSLYKLQSEQAISLVSASYTGILAGSSQVLIDKFLDSNGQNNTVDTINTDTVFNSSSNYYECKAGSGVTYANSIIISAQPSNTYSGSTGYSGLEIIHTENLDDELVILATFNFVVNAGGGNGANSKIKYYYTDTTTSEDSNYYNTDGTHIVTYNNPNPTKTVTKIEFYAGSNNVTGSYNGLFTLLKNTPIPTTATKAFISTLKYEELESGDSITCDISADGGSTYLTSQAINEWIDISSLSNTGSGIVKLNLNTSTGATTPKIQGWRVLIE